MNQRHNSALIEVSMLLSCCGFWNLGVQYDVELGLLHNFSTVSQDGLQASAEPSKEIKLSDKTSLLQRSVAKWVAC